jgi:hypothetical protein
MCHVSWRRAAPHPLNLPEPLEPHGKHKEARPRWSPLLPWHIHRGALPIRIYVVHQCQVMHDEARWLPSSPVCAWVMVEREYVDARRSGKRKWRARGRTCEEGPSSRRKLEQRAARVRRGEVQRSDVRRPSGRQGRRKAIYADLTAVFERRDHVSSRGEKRKVPDAVRCLILLNELYKKAVMTIDARKMA